MRGEGVPNTSPRARFLWF